MLLDNSASINDMMGRELLLPYAPKKIISLVPSLTELLYSLRIDERVVGITKFCIRPKDWKVIKPSVGGTKKINLSIIDQLEPDLIIANKEENSIQEIDTLSSKYPVWVSDINNFDDALYAIEAIGEITQSEKEAKRLLYQIHKAWGEITPEKNSLKTCAYLIWKDPIMAVGKNTFIDDMIKKLHLKNSVNEDRYPEIGLNKLEEMNPDILFLSSEPFPFNENHLSFFAEALPNSQIIIVDGEMFSWYGSRMKYAVNYFNKLLLEIHNK